MIRHIVVFRFRDGVSGDDRADLLAGLRALPERFPAMREFTMGVNQSRRDDRFTHGFTAEFADFDSLNSYLESQEHERFVAEEFRPLIAERAIVSFAGEGYPTPGPSPITARALARGRLELENWTMLTISQRLLAGAMGVPFLTTRSIAGSWTCCTSPTSAGSAARTFSPRSSLARATSRRPSRPSARRSTDGG